MTLNHLSFAHLSNSQLIEEMYEKYIQDPLSVDLSWKYFFEGFNLGLESSDKISKDDSSGKIRKLIDAYRMYGHITANVNPLRHLCHYEKVNELQLSTYGFDSKDLNKNLLTFGVLPKKEAPLQEIINYLEATYCSSMGIEYVGFIGSKFEKWLQAKIEPNKGEPNLSIDQKRLTLEYLNKSELFEAFLQLKYTGQKRFSIEGGETFIPMLQNLLVHGSEHGMNEFVIGMAHRGRLNVLCNIMKKSYSHIFCEFEKGYIPHESEGTSDVKYHKGYFSEVELANGKSVNVFLASNPSHLESVDPVVQGQVLSRQIRKGDIDKKQIIPILIHGDAALSGQGVVYETMQFSKLEGYETGGTIHFVINNHLGFTALPKESRSTRYCTDIARTFGAPVFHVNAEDPERCMFAVNLAVEIRQKFHCDVFIDVSCYRKYGHNESDEPMFTQPLHYKEIKSKKTIRELYREELISQGVVEKEMANELEATFKKALQDDLEISKTFKADSPAVELGESWEGFLRFPSKEIIFKVVQTGVDENELSFVSNKIAEIPEGFNLHKKLVRLVKDRHNQLQAKSNEMIIDWGTAEHLAFGTLLREGVSIRISGQDSQRGTFSHRQAVWIDQESNKAYIPLSSCENLSTFHVYNSSLSEEGVLGFETGYSMGYPQSLVIWEAQFGDFANGAQSIIDEYITASESKWGNLTGIVLLLPHGYEGQGPDHSSARMERFLQMAAGLNMFVVNASTPAQIFHLLRRQCHALYRKPLIVFSPKYLLRYAECKSSKQDLIEGGFLEIIEDEIEDKTTDTMVFCTGKIYYALKSEEKTRNWDAFACIRIEQVYPLHTDKVKSILNKYPNLKKILWVQEEPKNMGAWSHIRDELEAISGISPTYVGSDRLATPAMGTFTAYQERLKSIYDQFEQEIRG